MFVPSGHLVAGVGSSWLTAEWRNQFYWLRDILPSSPHHGGGPGFDENIEVRDLSLAQRTIGDGDTLERFSKQHGNGSEPADNRNRASHNRRRSGLEK